MKQRLIKAVATANLYLVESVDFDSNRSTSYIKLELDGYEKILLGDYKDLIFILSRWGEPVTVNNIKEV